MARGRKRPVDVTAAEADRQFKKGREAAPVAALDERQATTRARLMLYIMNRALLPLSR